MKVVFTSAVFFSFIALEIETFLTTCDIFFLRYIPPSLWEIMLLINVPSPILECE